MITNINSIPTEDAVKMTRLQCLSCIQYTLLQHDNPDTRPSLVAQKVVVEAMTDEEYAKHGAEVIAKLKELIPYAHCMDCGCDLTVDTICGEWDDLCITCHNEREE